MTVSISPEAGRGIGNSIKEGGVLSARHPKLVEFIRRKALRSGEFRLASGKMSSYYLDGKMVSFDPEGIALIVEAVLQEVSAYTFDAIGGMDMGATPIVSAIALRSHQLGRPIPTFTVRKSEKAHGTRKKIEGPIPASPCNVVVVDDVVTTGGSILEAIDALEAAGHRAILAISVVDRNGGGAEQLQKRHVPYLPLVSLADLGIQ